MKIAISFQKVRFLFSGFRSTVTTWEHRLALFAVVSQAIIGIGIAMLSWRLLPPKIPLWYSKPWGEERLMPPLFLFVPAATAVVVYIVNHRISISTAKEHPMFSRVLSLASLLVSLISAVIIIRVITLIT